MDIDTGKNIDGYTDRQTDRQTNRQTDRPTEKVFIKADAGARRANSLAHPIHSKHLCFETLPFGRGTFLKAIKLLFYANCFSVNGFAENFSPSLTNENIVLFCFSIFVAFS